MLANGVRDIIIASSLLHAVLEAFYDIDGLFGCLWELIRLLVNILRSPTIIPSVSGTIVIVTSFGASGS